MKKIAINTLISIQTISDEYFPVKYSSPFYQIFLIKGSGGFEIDFVEYECSGKTILFLAPYQKLKWENNNRCEVKLLKFHGEFYCIEYHKQEVACNGLLFNNIYKRPYFNLSKQVFNEIHELIEKIDRESKVCNPFSDSILKSYLQLILALSSKEKSALLLDIMPNQLPAKEIIEFQVLLEKYFNQEKSVSFYASRFTLSNNAFSKKIKQHFGKTPMQLIQERVLLESKKLLHLTHKSVKEIAAELHFQDEFYFSRYFKRGVGLSPTHYRDNVGISIVAK